MIINGRNQRKLRLYNNNRRAGGSAWQLMATLLFCLLIWPVSSDAAAPTANAAILFPQVREPYNQVFESIIAGIEQQYPGKVITMQMDKDISMNELRRWLKSNDIKAIVALGSHALKFTLQLQQNYPVVAGAVSIAGDSSDVSAISMHAAPEPLLRQLSAMQTGVNKIHVVIQDGKQQLWLKQAQQASDKYHFSLHAHPVNNLSEAAQRYHQLLADLDPKSDALWLVSGNNIMDNAIMKNILEIAWDRELLVFSNKLPDVKRGALFAAYPDNQAMGISLAAMLQAKMQATQMQPELQLLSDVKIALNLRTAKHLGLHLTKTELQNFELIYPLQ